MNKYKIIPERIVEIQKNIKEVSDTIAESKKDLEKVEGEIAEESGDKKKVLEKKMKMIQQQIDRKENQIGTYNSIINNRLKTRLEKIDKA